MVGQPPPPLQISVGIKYDRGRMLFGHPTRHAGLRVWVSGYPTNHTFLDLPKVLVQPKNQGSLEDQPACVGRQVRVRALWRARGPGGFPQIENHHTSHD